MIPLRDTIPARRFSTVCILIIVLNILIFLYESLTFPPKIGAFESSELMGYRGPSGRAFYETITLFSGANYADFERG